VVTFNNIIQYEGRQLITAILSITDVTTCNTEFKCLVCWLCKLNCLSSFLCQT